MMNATSMNPSNRTDHKFTFLLPILLAIALVEIVTAIGLGVIALPRQQVSRPGLGLPPAVPAGPAQNVEFLGASKPLLDQVSNSTLVFLCTHSVQSAPDGSVRSHIVIDGESHNASQMRAAIRLLKALEESRLEVVPDPLYPHLSPQEEEAFTVEVDR
jgi:hypothetical protein